MQCTRNRSALLEGQIFQRYLDGEWWKEGYLYPVLQLPLSEKRLVFESDDARVHYQKLGKKRSTAQNTKHKDFGPVTKMAKQNLMFS